MEINKGRRQELKKLKYKRRLKIYMAKSGSLKQYLNGDSINPFGTGLRTSGKPCSCYMCSPYKYDRAKEKQRLLKEIDTQLFP